ncbi:MAG: DNA primase [Parcubacteria group bacterium CG10_big_fil_rev_8_21_14_0_10_38_31]|nr:MAG: DNA primase [Parcubacteria group bacterium CG10_big_fil_rev_8_21_14_0_10_38_31]
MSSNVDQIKSRLSITDLVGSYIKLYKAGANFKAVCPFHNEKTPSFFVSPIRESWHCFGCNRGGDIFSFMMEIEGVDFSEALKILALRAGVELKRDDPRERNEKDILTKVTESAVSFYQGKLKEEDNARAYLKERGLNDDSIKNFHIGFAPTGWRNLYDFLKSKNFSDTDMEKAGMVIKSPKGYYDRFRSRIMFPIFGSMGQPVGFSGRIFGEESHSESTGAKYINSPQTPLFDKSKILYGFDKAKNTIRQENTCVLVEGQMDLLMSQQTSITNTVATSGTALTEEHLKIIKRLADNLILSFDTDEAGLSASERAVGMALAMGFDVKIADIKEKDPADLIKKSPEEWEEAIAKAKPFITFYLDKIISKFKDIKDARKEVEKKIIPLLSKIKSEIERSHYVSETAKAIRLPEEPVVAELKKLLKNNKTEHFTSHPQISSQNQVKIQKSRKQSIEDRLLGLILWQRKNTENNFKEVLETVTLKCVDLLSEEGKKILNTDEDELDENMKKSYNKLTFEAELSYTDSETLDKEAEILLAGLEKESLKERLEELSDKIRQFEIAGDQENLSLSLEEFQKLIKLL